MIMLPGDLTESSFVQDLQDAVLGVKDTLPGWLHSFFGSHWQYEDLIEEIETFAAERFGRPEASRCSDDVFAHIVPRDLNYCWKVVVLGFEGACCASCVHEHQGPGLVV